MRGEERWGNMDDVHSIGSLLYPFHAATYFGTALLKNSRVIKRHLLKTKYKPRRKSPPIALPTATIIPPQSNANNLGSFRIGANMIQNNG